jgi:eukaryotic-like serine/threonine-protein kinase
VIGLGTGEKVKELDSGAYIAGSVAVVEGRAYFGHYGNEYLSVDLEEERVVWSYRDRSFPYFSSPSVTGGKVVFGGRDRRLHCVRRADEEPLWTFQTRGRVDSSPVVVGEVVVFGSADGRVYVVGLEKGEERWAYDLGTAVSGSPGVAHGMIVIGSEDGNVYGFGAR